MEDKEKEEDVETMDERKGNERQQCGVKVQNQMRGNLSL